MAGAGALLILSWNVFLMPLGQSPRNEARAKAIAAELRDQDSDILCLQKVFDDDAREVIDEALRDRYPHRYGPANSDCALMINSGVYVLSKIPLSDYQELEFEDRTHVEVFSRKGAIFLSGSISGSIGVQKFQLLATHLQGDDQADFNPKHQRVRDRQIEQIRTELVEPNKEPGVPLFVCGDFSTPRGSESYFAMLKAFDAENGPGDRVTLDGRKGRNDLGEESGRTDELDYILVAKRGVAISGEWKRRIFTSDGWDDRHPERYDLSYRYAVTAAFTFDSR